MHMVEKTRLIEKKRKNGRGKKIFIILAFVAVLGGAALVYFLLNGQNSQAASAAATPTYNTTTVRRGTLSISASGSGTLVAGRDASLSFPVAGTVAEVDVKVGDVVEKDQVLAKLEDIRTLEVAVDNAGLTLAQAQQDLIDLQEAATTTLANAQQAVYDAQTNLTNTKADSANAGYARCTDEQIGKYHYEYQVLYDKYEDLLANYDSTDAYYYNRILPAKTSMDTAWANYQYCLGYTTYEVESSKVTLTLAEEVLRKAQLTLDNLTATGGVDPIAKMQAELKISNAELALETAKQNLAEAVMTAPFTGTILTVAGEAGDTVGTQAFITMADLQHPKIDFSVDETDMDLVKVGKLAEVTFDAIPDTVFTGTVVTVNPYLSSTGGYKVLGGVIELDLGADVDTSLFLNGMNASVEIISGKAENALLVPVEALRDLGDGTYAVFVVGSDGKPRLTTVEVGLMDATYAEIKSGLNQGDTVTTGLVETN